MFPFLMLGRLVGIIEEHVTAQVLASIPNSRIGFIEKVCYFFCIILLLDKKNPTERYR
jgi:hypothetical protein